jgi:NADPH-dependent glutamate synthase beta subunit-like oxidoreductase/ferredoxin
MPDERMRLLGLVRAESNVGHAERSAAPYHLNTGDNEWFLANISCQYACPAYTDVARYIAHVAAEDYEASYQINLEDNVIPGILGRVCARPCEPACRRGRLDEPIAICWLKRVAADYRGPWTPPERPPRTSTKTVGVVGAGPTGIAAARDLAKLGYGVTIYESLPVAGGMLTAGIPEWRLPRDLCKREIDEYLAALGVEIKVNTPVGLGTWPGAEQANKNAIPLDELMTRHDAVLIAAGTQSPQEMEIPGEDYGNVEGLYPGLWFMERVNLHQKPFVGRRVAVIGGGFTAMDCSRSSLRMGAEKVYVLYRRSRNEMQVYEEEAREAEIEGVDFRFLVSPVEIVEENNKVVGLKCIRNRLGEPDASGRRSPVPIPGSEFILDVDTVIAATGQSPETTWLPQNMGVALNRRKRIEVDNTTWMSNIPGLFAAGDYVAGARTIIASIGDGQKAAIAMDQYLRGIDTNATKVELQADFALVPYLDYVSDYHLEVTKQLTEWAAVETVREETAPDATVRMSWQPISIWTADTMQRRLVDGEDYDAVPRQHMPMRPLAQRWNLTTEVELGLPHQEAFQEARRCLQCQLNIFLDGDNCILCNACIEVCPTNVLHMADLGLVESVNGREDEPRLREAKSWRSGAAMIMDEWLCIRCGLCAQICPTNCITMQHYEPKLVKGELLVP